MGLERSTADRFGVKDSGLGATAEDNALPPEHSTMALNDEGRLLGFKNKKPERDRCNTTDGMPVK